MKRFAIMAVLGAMMCGSMIAGCGGGDDTETSVTNTSANGASSTTTEKDGE